MMEKSKKRKILSSAAILLLLAVLVALAFVPMFTKAAPTTARSAQIDPDAMTALDNCSAYVCGHDFSVELSGKIKARVFGIPFSQSVRGKRSVSNGEYFEQSESSSVFVSAGLKKTVANGKYSVAEGKSKGKSFEYGQSRELDFAEFVETYGKPLTGLTRYVTENAVTSAVRVDDNTFRYTLDPDRSTEFIRHEIKTALGAKNYPVYRSVVITLVTDGEKPASLVASENFDIDKFGGTSCTAEYSEIYTFGR